MFTQCPLGHNRHHINPFNIRKLCCFKNYFGVILISKTSKCHSVSQEILTIVQGIVYVLCMQSTECIINYILLQPHRSFLSSSDKSFSKTVIFYLSLQVRYSFQCMYIYENQTHATALCGDSVYQLLTKSVSKYRKYVQKFLYILKKCVTFWQVHFYNFLLRIS